MPYIADQASNIGAELHYANGDDKDNPFVVKSHSINSLNAIVTLRTL